MTPKDVLRFFFETIKLDPSAFYILPWPSYQQIFSTYDSDFNLVFVELVKTKILQNRLPLPKND